MTLVVVVVGLGFWLAYQAVNALVLLFLALVLANAMGTAVRGLQRLGLRRAAAAVGAHLLVLVLLVGAATLALPRLAEQTIEMAEMVPDWYRSTRMQLQGSSSHLLQAIGQVLPAHPWDDLLARARDGSADLVPGWSWILLPGLGFSLWFLATFLLSFHWCIAGEKTTHSLLLLLPVARRQAASEMIDDIQLKLGAFVRGQLILCVAVGLMAYGAYWWIGLPFAAVLAVVAGVLEAVPVLGPIIATVPAVVVALSEGWQAALWVILANTVIAQIESYVLVPTVMNRAVGVHPILSLAAIAGMFALLGPIGALLAIPAAAVLQTLVHRLVFAPPAPQLDPPDDRRHAAVLRYRGRELLYDLRSVALDHVAGDAPEEGAAPAEELLSRAEVVAEGLIAVLRDAPEGPGRDNHHATSPGPSLLGSTARVAMLAGATVAGLALLWAFRGAVALLAFAIVLHWTLQPVQALFSRRRAFRTPAIVAMYLGLLVLPAVGVYVVAPWMAANLERAAKQLGKLQAELPARWDRGTALQQLAAERIRHFDGTLADDPVAHTMTLLEGAIDWGAALARTAINALFVVFLAIYWSLDGEWFRRRWLLRLPPWRRMQAACLWRDLESEVGAYVRREVLLALLAAASVGILFGLMRFPFATTMALLTFAAWFVPWVGIALVLMAVWVAVGINYLAVTPAGALAQGLIGSAFVLALHAWFIRVLRPYVSDKVHVHPLSILVMAVAMVTLLGGWGLVLAPPLAAGAEAMLRAFRTSHRSSEAWSPSGDLATCRARFEEVDRQLNRNGWPSDAPVRTVIQRLDALLREVGAYGASRG